LTATEQGDITMPIVLLILGALGLLAIGAGWLQNVTVDGASQMHVDVFGWTLGPLSHGAWLLLASLLGMATMACLLGAFALFRRSRRPRGAATATAGRSAGRIREDARDSTSRRRDTGRARERVTADEEQVTATGGGDAERDTTVRDNIPHSDRGRFSDMQDDDVRNKAPDAASRATGDEEGGGDLADKAKQKAKGAFGRARDRR
jgi:hypothetical protein